MIALVRGELVKLRTTRTALGYASALALLTVAIVLITALAGHPRTISDKRAVLSAADEISALMLIFGVVGAGAEYRHHTLAPALLVAPGRARLLLARLLAFALAALAIGIALTLLDYAIGIPLLRGATGPSLGASDYLATAGGGLLAIVLSTVIGVGVGTLIGSQVPAVIGSMLWLFIVEPLSDLIGEISKFTIGQTETVVSGDSGGQVLTLGAAILVLAGWAVLLSAAGALVDRRRDIA